ncbi:MAG: hypothetical protein ACI90V_010925 [Bacillariaceae sp.]
MRLEAISFLPTFVELGIKYGQFTNDERGGLLAEIKNASFGVNNMLQLIACCFDNRDEMKQDKEFHKRADEELCNLLIELHEKDLLKKEDVKAQYLFGFICRPSRSISIFS